MDWRCPEDRGKLELREEQLVCDGCDKTYDIADGVPIFSSVENVTSTPAELADLLTAIRNSSPGDAAGEFCDRHDCSRREFGADWSFLLPAQGDGTILELGGGFGDDTRHLARQARAVVAVPSIANGQLLRTSLDAGDGDIPAICVLDRIDRLPLADGSIAAIALEDIAAAGFDLSDRNLSAVAREWRRVLAPGGTVLFGIKGPLARIRILQQARRALGIPVGSASFNRRIKRIAGGGSETSLRLGSTLTAMSDAGFPSPTIYAPLPDEHRTEIVIPVDDRRVVGYFLHNLIRQNSPAVRMAIRGAGLLNRLGMFRHFVPYYYLLFKLEG
jgi:SAM-dependent methyltransferase